MALLFDDPLVRPDDGDGYLVRPGGAALGMSDPVAGLHRSVRRPARCRYSLRPLQYVFAAFELVVSVFVSVVLLVFVGAAASAPLAAALAVAPLVGGCVALGLRLRDTITVDEAGITFRRGRRRDFHPWSEVQAIVSEERIGHLHIGARLAGAEVTTIRLGVLSGRRAASVARIAAYAPVAHGGVLVEHRGPWGTLEREYLVAAAA